MPLSFFLVSPGFSIFLLSPSHSLRVSPPCKNPNSQSIHAIRPSTFHSLIHQFTLFLSPSRLTIRGLAPSNYTYVQSSNFFKKKVQPGGQHQPLRYLRYVNLHISVPGRKLSVPSVCQVGTSVTRWLRERTSVLQATSIIMIMIFCQFTTSTEYMRSDLKFWFSW